MGQSRCPVCGHAAELGRDADYGERKQIRCRRCGPYVITRTALAMLNSRLHGDAHIVARLSHAIRSTTSEEVWAEITSTNLDSLISIPLPPVSAQLQNLLTWMKHKAGDNYLGSINIRDSEELAAIVGTVDQEGVQKLLTFASQEGWIDVGPGGESASLTPKAWQQTEWSKPDQHRMVSSSPASPETPEVIKGHCPKCGADRKADVTTSYVHRWENEDAMVWSIDTYRILRCRGCDTIYVQHENLFSENETVKINPTTGEWEPTIDPKVTYWPAPAKRASPEWHAKIADKMLRSLLDEIYRALDADLRTLATMGTRAVLDRAMELRGAEPGDDFAEKLSALVDKGIISQHEKEILLIMTDAGSAASHRGWRPEPDQIATILDVTEAFLHRAFVLGDAAAQVKDRVPPRPKKRKKR